MSCPATVVEWQVAQWTKMSRERSLSDRLKYSKENKDHNGKLFYDNVEKDRCKNSTTLREYYEEDLNPFTRDWRESLRTWNYSYTEIPEPSERKKKKVSWTKRGKEVE